MVIAGNAYLGKAVPALYGRVMPVTSYIVTTEPLGENRARSLIRDNEAVANTNFIVDYFRLTGDNRMLFGGRASYSTLEPPNLGAYMKPRMTAVFRSSRMSGSTMRGRLHRHHVEPDTGLRQAFSECLLCAWILRTGRGTRGDVWQADGRVHPGEAERFDLLSRVIAPALPGGALRTPLLVAAMLFYRLRDALS